MGLARLRCGIFSYLTGPVTILMTIVIQATTTKWLARKLDLLEE